MSATATCATPIKGSVYRMVSLNSCGNPVTGTGGIQVVSKAFVQMAMSPEYEDGEEFFQRTADGTTCVNQMDDPTLKRYTNTLDLCEINQTAVSYMSTARELTTGAGATGVGFAMSEGNSSNRFSFEMWQQVGGSNNCDPVTGLQRYVYHAWPNCGSAKIGDYTIANATTQMQLIFTTRAIGSSATLGWLAKNGSASWLPAGMSVVGLEHWLWAVTTTPPPAPACNPLAAL